MSKLGLAQLAIFGLLLVPLVGASSSSSSHSSSDEVPPRTTVHSTRTFSVEGPSSGHPFRRKTTVLETITETRTETFDGDTSSDTSSSRSSSTSTLSSSSNEHNGHQRELKGHKKARHPEHMSSMRASNGMVVPPCEGPHCFDYYQRRPPKQRDGTRKIRERIDGITHQKRINQEMQKASKARDRYRDEYDRHRAQLQLAERQHTEAVARHTRNLELRDAEIAQTQHQVQLARHNCTNGLRHLLTNTIDPRVLANDDICSKSHLAEVLAQLDARFRQTEAQHRIRLEHIKREKEAEQKRAEAAIRLRFEAELRSARAHVERQYAVQLTETQAQFERFASAHAKMAKDARNLTRELDAIYARLEALERERTHEETRRQLCDQEGCRNVKTAIGRMKPIELGLDDQHRLLEFERRMDQLTECLDSLDSQWRRCKRAPSRRQCFDAALEQCRRQRAGLDREAHSLRIEPIHRGFVGKMVSGTRHRIGRKLDKGRVAETYAETLAHYERTVREDGRLGGGYSDNGGGEKAGRDANAGAEYAQSGNGREERAEYYANYSYGGSPRKARKKHKEREH